MPIDDIFISQDKKPSSQQMMAAKKISAQKQSNVGICIEAEKNNNLDNNWLLTYVDTVTLLLCFFILLISQPGFYKDRTEIIETETAIAEKIAEKKIISIELGDKLLFEPASAVLTEGGENKIKELYPDIASSKKITVEGHTDNIPIANDFFISNWELSSGRASAVVRFLIQLGFDRKKISSVGRADTRPISTNLTAAGRSANRRVVLFVEPHENK